MLKYSRDSLNGHLCVAYNGGKHGVLEGHAELSLACADKSLGAVLRRLNDFDLKTCLVKVALFLSYIQTCVVCVGRPVEHKGDFCFLGGSGGCCRFVVFTVAVVGAAAACHTECEHRSCHYSGKNSFFH